MLPGETSPLVTERLVLRLKQHGPGSDPAVPPDQDTTGKGFPLLMFRLDSPQRSNG